MHDAHRHLGVLPAYPFYGGPAVTPDVRARPRSPSCSPTSTPRAPSARWSCPTTACPTPTWRSASTSCASRRPRRTTGCAPGCGSRPGRRTRQRTEKALALAGEAGVRALKLSFLLGGRADDPACRPELDGSSPRRAARPGRARAHLARRRLRHRPGRHAGRRYGDDVAIHLVHLGGGMSGHIKLIGGRFFDWIAAGKRVYTDPSWAIGFAPRWLAAEIERRGIGHDRVLFASDEPWGDHAGELRPAARRGRRRRAGRARLPRTTSRALYELTTPPTGPPPRPSADANQRATEAVTELTELEEKSLGEIPHPSLPAGATSTARPRSSPTTRPRTARPTSPWSTASPTSRRSASSRSCRPPARCARASSRPSTSTAPAR